MVDWLMSQMQEFPTRAEVYLDDPNAVPGATTPNYNVKSLTTWQNVIDPRPRGLQVMS